MKKQYEIKPMQTEAEIDGKGYVHWKSWQETYAGLIDPVYLDTVMTLDKCVAMARRWPQNQMVAKDGDRVIGFNGYDPDAGEVVAVYVLREYQGRRVGYELLNAAIERLAACETIGLWVLEGNEKAIRFYEKYGFRFDGAARQVTYGSPRTALRMVYERKL